MNKAAMLSEISKRTGLKRETIKDLMKNGWVFEINDAHGRFVKGTG